MSGFCTSNDTYCFNDTKTGPKCNEICSDVIYSKCRRCDSNYICFECTTKRSYGLNCTENYTH